MKEVEKIVKAAQKSCERKDGRLKNLTIKEIEELRQSLSSECGYCPDNYHCEICGGLEDIIYLNMCYKCDKCGKWSISKKEYWDAISRDIDDIYDV